MKKTLIIIAIVITTGVVVFAATQKSSKTPVINLTQPDKDTIVVTPTPTPTPTPNIPTPATPPNTLTVKTDATCKQYTPFSCDEYFEGWKKTFKTVNNLSEAEFNAHVKDISVSAHKAGNNTELSVRYTAYVNDWVSESRVDDILLLKQDFKTIRTPNELYTEKDPAFSGRAGISSMILNKPLAFTGKSEAISFFATQHSVSANQVIQTRILFQYFWNVEKEPTTIGVGGESVMIINGTINESANECFIGYLGLLNKKSSLQETPCFIT